MQIKIPYGSKTFATRLPADAALLTVAEAEKRISADSFRDNLRNHLRHTPLDLRDTIIVICDKTRLCGYSTYLPILIEILKEFGLQEDSLRFIIAYGTHPRQTDAECLANYGEIYSSYTFIHHDCRVKDQFVERGTTSRNIPVRLRRDIAAASAVITMGPICHHYFAGYGGGRKLLFPGCGEREAIYANHSLFLDRKTKCLSPGCQPGILEENPLAEDLFEMALEKEIDLSLHGIMDSHGEVCDIIIGITREDFLQACSVHGNLYESTAKTASIVIASCGGYPKDINFIQSHKAIHNASMFVSDGGTLLIFSECRDGIGSQTFMPWFEMGGFDNAFDYLIDNYQGNGGTALAMMTKTSRIRIVMVTELDNDTCSKIGVTKWSYDQALQYIAEISAPVSYIANASLVVRKV